MVRSRLFVDGDRSRRLSTGLQRDDVQEVTGVRGGEGDTETWGRCHSCKRDGGNPEEDGVT